MNTARAIVAEDEPLLAQGLVAELASAWPELRVDAIVGDGLAAVDAVLAHRPDIVFLDIRMPSATGLEAAEAIAEDWPDDAGTLPLIVFVTAYDQYAVEAFERAAFDYLLKPVEPARLARTCKRLRASLEARTTDAMNSRVLPLATASDAEWSAVADRLRTLLSSSTGGGAAAAEPVRVIQAGAGQTVRMVPVDDVVYFEAADKYVRVLTSSDEHLIRLSLRELLPRLDATRFWQIHRSVVVRADAIESAARDEAGKVTLKLRSRPETLAVSRLHAARFRAM